MTYYYNCWSKIHIPSEPNLYIIFFELSFIYPFSSLSFASLATLFLTNFSNNNVCVNISSTTDSLTHAHTHI